MSDLLIIGVADDSGWGYATQNLALACDVAGLDVSLRLVHLTGGKAPLSPRIRELAERSSRGAHTAIQCVLPDLMERGKFDRQVGYYFTETSGFGHTRWADHINLMDEAWVACQQSLIASRDSGVNVPLKIVPPSCDLARYEQRWEPLSLREDLTDRFIFYTINEAIPRKNFPALITAFHLEFQPDEPVELLIKTGSPGKSPEEARLGILRDIAGLKQNLNLYQDPSFYKKEMILTERLSPEAICRLHATGDCYVSPSYGEGWGIGAFDAMGFGKTPILSATGGHLGFADDTIGWVVPTHPEPVMGMQKIYGSLYSAKQSWDAVNVADLRRSMREAYENKSLRETKSKAGRRHAYNFSHRKIGKLIKEILTDENYQIVYPRSPVVQS